MTQNGEGRKPLGNRTLTELQEDWAKNGPANSPELEALLEKEYEALNSPELAKEPFAPRGPLVWKQPQKDNFIEWFIYLQGLTSVPANYYRFVALSILSAVLQNKVWVEFSPGDPLYPNLYVFLIGGSGIGKGRAISAGMRFLESCALEDYCGRISGSLTSAALIDFLASKKGAGTKPNTSRAYIVHPELASSLKWGDHADSFIKRMTDLYTADLNSYTDMTRGGGIKTAGKPCVSWLAASTKTWLISNLKSDALGGGFMARGLFVEEVDKVRGILKPIPPPDWPEVTVKLKAQMTNTIQQLSGEFTLEPDALGYLETWFEEREEPETEAQQASFNRYLELGLKIGTILCAAEPNTNQRITKNHLVESLSLVEMVKAEEAKLWAFILQGGKLSDTGYIAKKIKDKSPIEHSVLLKYANNSRGLLERPVKDILITLEQAGVIRSSRLQRKGGPSGTRDGVRIYTWVENGPSLSNFGEDDE